jgi:hypothetical protein
MYWTEGKATGRQPYFGHFFSEHLLAVCMAATAPEMRGVIIFFFIFADFFK